MLIFFLSLFLFFLLIIVFFSYFVFIICRFIIYPRLPEMLIFFYLSSCFSFFFNYFLSLRWPEIKDSAKYSFTLSLSLCSCFITFFLFSFSSTFFFFMTRLTRKEKKTLIRTFIHSFFQYYLLFSPQRSPGRNRYLPQRIFAFSFIIHFFIYPLFSVLFYLYLTCLNLPGMNRCLTQRHFLLSLSLFVVSCLLNFSSPFLYSFSSLLSFTVPFLASFLPVSFMPFFSLFPSFFLLFFPPF